MLLFVVGIFQFIRCWCFACHIVIVFNRSKFQILYYEPSGGITMERILEIVRLNYSGKMVHSRLVVREIHLIALVVVV